MLAFIIALLLIGGLLFAEESLGRLKILKGEYHRKLTHVGVGILAASWPWYLSWNQIKVLGILSLIFALFNRFTKIFSFTGHVRRTTYGDIFFSIAIVATAWLTHVKLYYTLIMLIVGVSDTAAALIGEQAGKRWRYRIFGQTKTVYGTMAFWFCSLLIFGVGLLWARDLMPLRNYVGLIICLPPILAATENISPFGSDNLTVPLVAVAILHWVQF